MKIGSVGAELFHVDGRTDRHDEANCGFFFVILRKNLKIHRKNYTLILHKLIHSLFCAFIFMLSACSPPKCRLSCPHHMKGCAGLIYLLLLEVGEEKLN